MVFSNSLDTDKIHSKASTLSPIPKTITCVFLKDLVFSGEWFSAGNLQIHRHRPFNRMRYHDRPYPSYTPSCPIILHSISALPHSPPAHPPLDHSSCVFVSSCRILVCVFLSAFSGHLVVFDLSSSRQAGPVYSRTGLTNLLFSTSFSLTSRGHEKKLRLKKPDVLFSLAQILPI